MPPPVELKLIGKFKHTGLLLPITITGLGLTTTLVVALFTQPFASVPVTVYDVDVVGVALTGLPLEELNPVAGLQVYVVAPLAVSVAVC